ncbi:MAG: multiheme c-type cytochrome [Burkholderiaceae bacterium]
MYRNHVRSLLIRVALFAGLLSSALVQATTPLPNRAPQQSVGTVNCAGSTCHGSVTPWTESHVLQNEYTTWLRLDRHAKAHSTLLSPQSSRIAKNLGLKEAAHEAKVCLDCHAHNPAPAQRGERHTVTDGVGCEACHGPAEKWIKPHTAPDATHAKNVANGLYPLSKPVEQATLCLSCHFGDESRFVSHRIMGAGHPRISFELDTFSAIAPAHYRIDEDWRKRKGDYDSTKLWVIGQALASKQLLDTLVDPKRGRDGMFPELVLFDCHSCHHPMSEQKWSPRLGVGPGRIRLNDSNLLMLRAIVHAYDPARADAFSTRVSQLHQAVSGSEGGDPHALARKLSASIGDYIARFEKEGFDQKFLRQVLKALIDEADSASYSDYAGAEQAYLSISSLASSMAKQGSLKSPEQMNRHLASMRKILANENRFRPEAFGAELAAMRKLVLPATSN